MRVSIYFESINTFPTRLIGRKNLLPTSDSIIRILLKINVIGSIVTHILKDFKWEKWYIIQILILSILPLFWKHYVSFLYHFLPEWKPPSISFRALWPLTDFKFLYIWKCLCFTLISQNVFLPYTKLWIDSFFICHFKKYCLTLFLLPLFLNTNSQAFELLYSYSNMQFSFPLEAFSVLLSTAWLYFWICFSFNLSPLGCADPLDHVFQGIWEIYNTYSFFFFFSAAIFFFSLLSFQLDQY